MMKHLIWIIVGAGFGLAAFSAGAAEDPFEDLGPIQALDRIQHDIDLLDSLGKAILANTRLASENARELAELESEKAKLDGIEADYGTRAFQHNADADLYNKACATSAVDLATFNKCMSWKADLDYARKNLAGEKAGLIDKFADYNRRVEDFNGREQARADRAKYLAERYDQISADIRALQIHLNALGVVEGGQDFASKNQKCTGLSSLSAMHGCMVAIWEGGKKP